MLHNLRYVRKFAIYFVFHEPDSLDVGIVYMI